MCDIHNFICHNTNLNTVKMESTILKIIKNSWRILLITSILSSLGGLSLETFKHNLIKILPLLIAYPIVSDTLGNFSIVISSKFTTLLYEGKIKKENYFSNKEVRKMLKIVLINGLFFSVIISILSLLTAFFNNFQIRLIEIMKIILVITFIICTLIFVMFFAIFKLGFYLYEKNKDPDDILIPISTSLSDLITLFSISFISYVFF